MEAIEIMANIKSRCPNCGNVIRNKYGREMFFCPFCGTSLTESEDVFRDILDHDQRMEEMGYKHELYKDKELFRNEMYRQRNKEQSKAKIRNGFAEGAANFFSIIERNMGYSVSNLFDSISSGMGCVLKVFTWVAGIIFIFYFIIRLIGKLIFG